MAMNLSTLMTVKCRMITQIALKAISEKVWHAMCKSSPLKRWIIRYMKTTVISRSASAKLKITMLETVLRALKRHIAAQTKLFPNQVVRNKTTCKATVKILNAASLILPESFFSVVDCFSLLLKNVSFFKIEMPNMNIYAVIVVFFPEHSILWIFPAHPDRFRCLVKIPALLYHRNNGSKHYCVLVSTVANTCSEQESTKFIDYGW